MEDPPPTATWHPALRPETLDDASLYSPDPDGPRLVTLSWDDVVARTPMRSRAPTHSLQQIQQDLPTTISEESDLLESKEQSQSSRAEPPKVQVDGPIQGQEASHIAPAILENDDVGIQRMEEKSPNSESQTRPAVPSIESSARLAQLYTQAPVEEVPVEHVEVVVAHTEAPDTSSTTAPPAETQLSTNHADTTFPEPTSPLDLFPSTKQQASSNEAIDAAWGNIGRVAYTNSFPEVPPAPQSVQPPIDPFPHSQAAAVMKEDELEVGQSHATNPTIDYPWDNSHDSTEDGGFFSKAEPQEHGLTTPLDDEARFEEGIPLVTQTETAETNDPFADEPDFTFGEHKEPTEDAFFSGLGGSHEEPDHQHPAALTRKTTEQVLNTMQLSQDTPFGGESIERIDEADNFFSNPTNTQELSRDTDHLFADGWSGSPQSLSKEPDLFSRELASNEEVSREADQFFTNPSATKEPSEEAVSKTVIPPKGEDKLAALWEAALDDDLLDESVDPSSFFGDEDDGFLPDPAGETAALPENVSTTPATQPLGQSSAYANQNYNNTGPSSYAPAGFNMAAYQRSQSPFQTQPAQPAIIERAQSFADKSKGGYASPYDAPMDLSRPRRAPAARAPQVLTRGGPAATPPPRRSDSVQSGYTGTPTIPQVSPTFSSAYSSAPSPYQAAPSASQKAALPHNAASSGFFEELPVVPKSRPSTSSARFAPQPVHQNAPPPSSTPPRSITQPPQQPSPPTLNQYGLVGPAKLMPYADAAAPVNTPPVQPPAPSAVSNRYSPSPSQQVGQQQLHQTSRTVPPNPYAAAGGIARPPSVPHQHAPSKPSPLARSSSANQYRPGDQPIDPPVLDSRQILGARRPSLLSYAQNMEQDQHSQGPQRSDEQDAAVNNHSPEKSTDHAPQNHGLAAPHNATRAPSYLPAHAEVETPRMLPIPYQTATKPRLPAKDVECYSISQQSVLTSVNRVRAPSLTGNDNFMPPDDPVAHDPLKRWQGAPIFRFGFGGAIVTTFPTRVPRYAQGSRVPVIKSSPGQIRLSTSKVLPSDEHLATFPGPLKNKNKKKDVLPWLHNRIASLAQAHTDLVDQGMTGDDQKRHEEKIMLWKILATLVEYDGVIDGNGQALDAVRKILSPEATVHKDQQSITQPFLPAISSPDTSFKPSATQSSSIDTLRQSLLTGEREKAVWYAVDQKLWGHAMLIASTMPRDLWKQVVHEFVRNEVKPAGRNTESLAALYDVFAGSWEESVDELVPPSARAGLTLMNKNVNGSHASSGLDGLNRWRETLNLILSNRTAEDAKAMVAMGQLLTSYGRVEAAHICYIFARVPGLFGGPDETQSAIVLLGVDHKQSPLEFAKDADGILLTEVYEFVLSVLSPTPSQASIMPHLQAFKLHHAELLAELGRRDEAQQYCDSIIAAMKANTNRSPYYHPQLASAVDTLGVRLRQAGKEGSSSWISRPNVDKVSGSFLKALSGFIAGDEDETSAASARADTQGPFARINGNTPEMLSRTSSPALGAYAQYGSAPNYGTGISQMPTATNSRYAPGSVATSYTPNIAPLTEQQPPTQAAYQPHPTVGQEQYMPYQQQQAVQATQAPQTEPLPTNNSKYGPRATMQTQGSSYFPTMHSEGPMSASSSDAGSSRPGGDDEPRIANTMLSPRQSSSPYQAVPPATNSRYSPSLGHSPRPASLEPTYSSYEPRSAASQPRSYAPSPNLGPATPNNVDSYQPSAPMYGEYTLSSTQNPPEEEPTPTAETPVVKQDSDESTVYGNFKPAEEYGSAQNLATPTYGTYEPPSAGYQPPSYGYEPPSYDPDTVNEEEPKSPRKKKSIMDLDDDEDDLASRAASLKQSQKSAKDKAADDAFKRAAEEDAKKAAAAKSGGGGWLSGIWGRGSSKDQPKAHKIHEGEKNSFVFDKELNKWVNKKAGAEDTTASAPTPPPPRGPPKPMSSAPPPGARPPTSHPANGPPSSSLAGSASPGLTAGPTSGPPQGLTPGLAPPSRPATGMSTTSNASSIDDLMGPAQPRKGGTMKKGKKRAGYVDVLADKT